METQSRQRRSNASSDCARRYLAALRMSCCVLSSFGAEAFVQHHPLGVMRPTFHESVAAENFLEPAGARGVQAEKLRVVSGYASWMETTSGYRTLNAVSHSSACFGGHSFPPA